MKFLCLANYQPAGRGAMPPEALRATGQLRLGASLGPDKDLIRLEPRGGKTQVTDGAFAEAKERVGGLFMIEDANREEASA